MFHLPVLSLTRLHFLTVDGLWLHPLQLLLLQQLLVVLLLLLYLVLLLVRLLLENFVRPLSRPPRQLDPDAALAVPLYPLESLPRKGMMLNRREC